MKKVLQQASLATRVGADPETDPCGASAVLRTKRYRLEAFGRQEAAESKKRNTEIRMPEEFIKKVMDMPNMEIEVQLCGDDEYFAEGALIELQQGAKRIKAIDIGKAERGRKMKRMVLPIGLDLPRSLLTSSLTPLPHQCLSSICKTAKKFASPPNSPK